MASSQIESDDEVFRRLPPDAVDRVRQKAKRNAFYTRGEPDKEASVHVRRLAPDPHKLLSDANRPHFGMGLLTVAEIRALGLDVRLQPLPGDEAHAVIVEKDRKIDRDACDDLAEICDVVIWPATPDKP